ncbi:helix-turn-helix domain-containing protein [Actinokineospora fastidiosa]|uniref:Transcriptional regulator n=1 Tax=Actinokineospora fastidiosa TaxID=1816 RepID=A0A918G300_9PSEU|nr:helix-turn-helix transcriptional regulator [Actinokineospora fastidiosa]GGS14309.1 transcriptional regulator [Actinokineospora fastidiosa]
MARGRQPDPKVQRRRLGDTLRVERERVGLTQAEAARAVDWSLSKLLRIENASVGISTSDTKALLAVYGTADDVAEQLLVMARESRRPSWYAKYRKVLSPEYQTLLSYEDSAIAIRHVHPYLVPGLLQTPGYARALLGAAHEGEKLDALIAARVDRQAILHEDPGPELSFLIDEGALHRMVGGPQVMREQLRHLRHLSDKRNIDIRVIPYDAGVHRGLWGPFVTMLLDGGSVIVYVENAGADYIVRDGSPRIDEFGERLSATAEVALSASQTKDFLEDRIAHLVAKPIGPRWTRAR